MSNAFHYQNTFRDPLAQEFTSVLSVLYDPLEMAGLAAWYDGADESTINVVNDQITVWQDKSGNDYHLGPVAGEALPSVSGNLQNGRTGVFFDYALKEMLECNYTAAADGSLSTFNVLLNKSLGQIIHGQRILLGTFITHWVITGLDCGQNFKGFLASLLQWNHSMHSKALTPNLFSLGSVLDNIRFATRWHDAHPEAGKLGIKDEIVFGLYFCGLYKPLGKFWHWQPLFVSIVGCGCLLPWKHYGSKRQKVTAQPVETLSA